MTKFIRAALILPVFLLAACRLFALPAARNKPPLDRQHFALQDGKRVEWRNDAYYPPPMDGMVSKNTILPVENNTPMVK
jgi:hypothetical protein